MWYLIGVAAVVLIGFFLYTSMKKNKRKPGQGNGTKDGVPFRTEEDLNSYSKPMDDRHSHVDFDDAE